MQNGRSLRAVFEVPVEGQDREEQNQEPELCRFIRICRAEK